MKKALLLIALICSFSQLVIAQDSIKQSVVLIGDAGEINTVQQAIIADAIKRSAPGKTTALYLGDNIYRYGMGLNQYAATRETEDILRSQYEPFRKAGIPVYFIPGNHDWDHSGPKGYDKIIRANEFIRAQQDSLLQMIPKDGCPGPVEIALSEELVILAIDSEWWLYPFSTHSETSECECKSRADVLGRLEDLVERNRNKLIIFASHHPFISYGTHGGHYTLKDHIFPLTNLNKNLYLPLPVIGSLYPVLRSTFPSPEDIGNVLYQEIKEGIENVLKKHPNVVHVAGHEHTLQLIQGALLELVSGAGSRKTDVKKGKGSLFAMGESGYAIADILLDSSIRISFYSYKNDSIQHSFTFNKAYTQPPPVVVEDAAVVTGDSIKVAAGAPYNKAGRFHRKLFGNNYRDVWAAEVNLPVLRISEKGLVPTETGGGMQTRSLRLEDLEKNEWVLRSVEKYPDLLLPPTLANTLAAEILKDNVTAAFPYAPLVVPVFAGALNVHHATPQIVYLAPDKGLGSYSRNFAETINLFEEREPAGKSISTLKMIEKLKEDNDGSVDQEMYLTARLLDIFMGDWDRHGDQWRWIDANKTKDKFYRPVPRDRDQVFYINQGLFPAIFALPWLQPKFQGFGDKIRNINTFSFNARFIDGIFTNRISYEQWTAITTATIGKLSDTLIETALAKLPLPVYNLKHLQLARQLKNRRLDLLRKSPRYFSFLNKEIDVKGSDKDEFVKIKDTIGGKLSVSIFKLSKNEGAGKLIFYRLLHPSVTKELRLFLFGGRDSVVIDNSSANIKLRIVGDGRSRKSYVLTGSSKYLRKVHLYDGPGNAVINGNTAAASLHLSSKQGNTAFEVTSRYDKTIPLLNTGYNMDDGLILGAGIRFIRQGFRKSPYGSSQQVNLSRAFYTNSFRIQYTGEWLKSVGEADILLRANIFAPDNTQNFFGRGNETVFNKTGDFRRHYRSVFTILQAEPAFRWRTGIRNSITVGPSVQYYKFDADDNKGRFINNISSINSYDSATIANDKAHGGVVFDLAHDSRNNLVLPSGGSFLNLKLKGYSGLNSYSKSFVQVTSEVALFKQVDRKANLVIANRLGGGFSIGKTAFYQSLFLGGHNNLQGFRQFRFAGQHMMYNNLEARLKIANIASYLVPGQLGIVGFYDIGRVWENGESSSAWHKGAGGGIYFSPAQLLLLQLVAGKSAEGWLPYFTMGFRF